LVRRDGDPGAAGAWGGRAPFRVMGCDRLGKAEGGYAVRLAPRG